MDNLIVDFQKLVNAVKQAAMEFQPICDDKKEALRAAVTLAANLVNVPLCVAEMECDEGGCEVEGEEWKRGQREDEE